MKISFKNKDTSFSLPLPIWLVDIIPSTLINVAIKHHVDKNEEMILTDIDFAAIKKSLHILKDFKGLNILELKNEKGDEVSIKV